MALTDNLTAYYKADETSGTTFSDSTGNGKNGTAETDLSSFTTTGKINAGIDTTSYGVSLGSYIASLLNTSSGSVSVWFKVTSAKNSNFIISKEQSGTYGVYNLYTDASNNILIGMDSGGGNNQIETISGQVTTGSWVHLVHTWDGTYWKVYINGSLVSTTSHTRVPTSNGNGFYIGRHVSNSSNKFSGVIDEIGIWSRALTSTEVTELYNSGDGLTYPFSTDVTIYPSVLSVSTSEETINIRLNLAGESLQSTISLKTAIITAVNPVPPTYKIGQKELRTSWDELTSLDPTKRVGHIQNLIPLVSLVPSRYNIGI